MTSSAETQFPSVVWGGKTISRLLIGHNPFKGQSHFNEAMDREMAEWYVPATGHDLEILRACEEQGINTAQFGAPAMHSILRRYRRAGGSIQWIATFYGLDNRDPDEEIAEILSVDPKPIGLYYYGGRLDSLFLQGAIAAAADNLKRLRDTGLLVGVGSHLPELMQHIESEEWDVDFYETCAYTVYANKATAVIDVSNEIYNDADRERMFAFIKQASKPCIAFKVLGANRNCGSETEVYSALKFAYENVKPSDVVLVGMWQRHKNQVAQNAGWVREILARIAPIVYERLCLQR